MYVLISKWGEPPWVWGGLRLTVNGAYEGILKGKVMKD